MRGVRNLFLRGLQRLFDVGLDVFHIFEANGQPDVIGGHAGFFLLGGRQLLMRRRGRMNHQALGVADVGEM